MNPNNNVAEYGYASEMVDDKIITAMEAKAKRMKSTNLQLTATARVLNPIKHDCVVIEKEVPKTDASGITKLITYVAVILVNQSYGTIQPKDVLTKDNEVLAPFNLVDATAIKTIKDHYSGTNKVILLPIVSKLENLEYNMVVAYDSIISFSSNNIFKLTALHPGTISTNTTFNPKENIIDVSLFNKQEDVITGNTRGNSLSFQAHLNHIHQGDKLYKQIVICDNELNGCKTVADLFYTLTTQFGDVDQLNARSRTNYGSLLPLVGYKKADLVGRGNNIAQMFHGTIISIDLKAYTTNAIIKRLITSAAVKGGQYSQTLINNLNAEFGFPIEYPLDEIFLIGEVKVWGQLVTSSNVQKPIEQLTLAEVYERVDSEAVINDFKSISFQGQASFLNVFNPFAQIDGTLLRLTFTSKFIATLVQSFENKGYIRESINNSVEHINAFKGVDISAGDVTAYQTSASSNLSSSGGYIMVL